jgi:hypothetical protein
MRKFLICILASVVLAAGLSIGCGEKTEAPKTIDYQVIRQWAIPAGGIGMEILVSEDATKEEVLALANSLRSKYLPGGYIYIQIFDSLSAYTHRDDPTYPEEEYFKHFLVDIARNPKTGYDEISWVAKGRGH